MPIYEYDCLECGHRFEFLAIRSDERAACPKCESERIEKAFSVFSSKSAPSGRAPCGAPAPT